MNYKILSAILGCSCAIGLSFFHPLWMIPALGFLLWLGKLALDAQKDSETDALTGLWNLRRLENRRGHYEKCTHLTVFYFDLDDLKQVNDTRGHHMGNAALQEMAHCLLQAADTGAAAYRIGGDEFLLIAETADSAALTARWEQAAKNLKSSAASFGCAAGTGRELDALIREAEQAMYDKK